MEHKKKSAETAVVNSKKVREKQGGIPGINKKASGLKLRRIMDAQGISVKEMQKYLGLGSVQSVYHWLNGISMPTVDNLYAMSELLQVSMDEMVCGNRTWDMARRGFGTGDAWSKSMFTEDVPGRFYGENEKEDRAFLEHAGYFLYNEMEAAAQPDSSMWLFLHLFQSERGNEKRVTAYYKKAGGDLAA